MVFARVKSTLTIKDGGEDRYNLLRVKHKLMSSFSDEWMDTYKMTNMFDFNRDDNLLRVRGTELGGIPGISQNPGIFISAGFEITSYPLTWLEEIAPLIYDGFIEFTYLTETYHKYIIINGKVIKESGGLYKHFMGWLREEGIIDGF